MATLALLTLWLSPYSISEAPRPCLDMLTETIYFKVAAQIQQKYLELPQIPRQVPEFLFYKAITELALGHPIDLENLKEIASKLDGDYQLALEEMMETQDPSVRHIRKILRQNSIPLSVKLGKSVLIDPFGLLPDESCLEGGPNKIDYLWRAFYTAIFLQDKKQLGHIYARLAPKVADFQKDKKRFEGIFQAFMKPDQKADAIPLAWLYLASGDNRIALKEHAREEVERVKAHYLDEYYEREHIVVNRYTLKNKVYLWLVARHEENKDPELARVFLKATFSSRALVEFHPDNQVLLYATIRNALRLNNVASYQYVFGSLDPLISGKSVKLKNEVRSQLLQLMD